MNKPTAFGAYSNVVFNYIQYLCSSFLLLGKVQLLLNIFNYQLTARHSLPAGLTHWVWLNGRLRQSAWGNFRTVFSGWEISVLLRILATVMVAQWIRLTKSLLWSFPLAVQTPACSRIKPSASWGMWSFRDVGSCETCGSRGIGVHWLVVRWTSRIIFLFFPLI